MWISTCLIARPRSRRISWNFFRRIAIVSILVVRNYDILLKINGVTIHKKAFFHNTIFRRANCRVASAAEQARAAAAEERGSGMGGGRDRDGNMNAGAMKVRGAVGIDGAGRADRDRDREDMRGDRDGRDRDDVRGGGVEAAGGRRGSMSGGAAKDVGSKPQRRASLGGGGKDGHAHGHGDGQVGRRGDIDAHGDVAIMRGGGGNVDDSDMCLDRGTIKRAGRALIARHQGGRESRHHGGRESRAHRASASAGVQHTRSYK